MKDLEAFVSSNDNEQMDVSTIDVSVGEYVTGGHFLLPPIDRKSWISDPQLLGAAEPLQVEVNGKDGTQLAVFPSTFQDSNKGHFLHQINVPTNQSISHNFSHQLFPETFSEHVSISALPVTPHHSCAAFCNYELEQHCKDTVHLETAMAPVGFNASIICYKNCSKKRFRTTINCEPRLRQVRFEETQFVRPKRLEARYVSYLDYKTETTRQWYTSGVQMNQKACCSSFVQDFQFNENDSENGEDELGSIGSSELSDDEGITIVGCRDSHNGYAGHESEIYRTKVVIGQ